MTSRSGLPEKRPLPESEESHDNLDVGYEDARNKRPRPESRSTSPSRSVTAGFHTGDNEEWVITNIRATDVALGLRRMPVSFCAVVLHSGLEWRTKNQRLLVYDNAVEWTGPIPLPSDSSAILCLEIYASFEFQPILGSGEQLRSLEVKVEQLLDNGTKDIPFVFSPTDGDVVSPCSSILATVRSQKQENTSPSTSRVLGPHGLITESRNELEHATNDGHSALLRYRKHGEKQDLERSVERFRLALNVCPLGHPCRAAAQSNLAMARLILCQVENTDASLDIPFTLYRSALATRSADHVDRSLTLIQLASVHLVRFEKRKDRVDLAQAEALLHEAMDLSSLHSYENRAASFILQFINGHKVGSIRADTQSCPALRLTDEDPWVLGTQLLHRFERFGDLVDLQQAIVLFEDLVRTIPVWDHDHHGALGNLSVALSYRFKRLGKLSDLKDAISKKREIVGLIPDGHPDKPTSLSNLGDSLLNRFEHLGALSDLDEAISKQRDAVNQTPHGHPDEPRHLNNLGISLLSRFQRLGELDYLEDALLTLRNAVDLTPHGLPAKVARLSNLGNAFLDRFERLGELNDLENAISRFRDSVELSPRDHPDKPTYLTSLGIALDIRYLRLQEPSDLEDAISTLKDAIDLTPNGHPARPRCLNNFATSLNNRFRLFGEPSDIDCAISRHRDAVDLTPLGHPSKSTRLESLGNSLRTRFDHFGELADLEGAISTLRDAVDLTPDGHPAQHRCLNNLGICFLARFECLGELSDLQDAISVLGKAIDLVPHGHFNKLRYLNNLGNTFKARFQRVGEPHDLEQAISLYLHAASAPVGPVRDRLQASLNWISCARRILHHSLIHAYSTVLGLLPELGWVGFSLSHRYSQLKECADVVREAAATALDFGFPEIAVEWLEQGRSIVWGELFQLRSSYEQLRSTYPYYARRLREVSVALELAGSTHEKLLSELSAGVARNLVESIQYEAEKHRALAIQRDRLLQEIRRLPGFEQFLLRKQFSQLRASAHSGPVVILNAAEIRCDALIVLVDVDHVIHVPLPTFTLERSSILQGMLEELLGHARVTRSDDREGNRATRVGVTWKSLLSTLWNDLTKPVLSSLAFSQTPGELSRVFWCPTGPLVFLPIHGAGIYDTQYSQPGHKVSDFIVSSYVPTLSVLALSRDAGAASSGDFRLLLVRQPPSDGLSQLPGVDIELEHVKTAIRSARSIVLESSLGTVEEVLSLMKEADWVHFACHGIQDDASPAESGLCLADGRRLKISDIIALSRPRGGLAFLSACQTAMGDEVLSDEAIHIAAGMLFAGYGGVVGTMWSISDKLAPDVAKGVYTELFRSGTHPEYREAARALHRAIGCLRNGEEGSFATWLPFIHVGL